MAYTCKLLIRISRVGKHAGYTMTVKRLHGPSWWRFSNKSDDHACVRVYVCVQEGERRKDKAICGWLAVETYWLNGVSLNWRMS